MDPTPSLIGRYLMAIISLVMILLGIVLIMLPIVFPGMGQEAAEFIKEMGRLFVPIGSISLIYEFILRGTFVAEMRKELSDVLNHHLTYASELRQAGIVRIHEGLPIHEVQKLFSAETSRIRILTTWIHEYNAYGRALRQAVEHGCRIELLILDPASAFTKQRSLDLGYDDAHGQTISQTNLRELHRDFSAPELRERLEVRCYDCLPSLVIHMAGEQALVGYYPHFKLGTHALQLEIQGLSTPYGRAVTEEFEALWSRARRLEI